MRSDTMDVFYMVICVILTSVVMCHPFHDEMKVFRYSLEFLLGIKWSYRNLDIQVDNSSDMLVQAVTDFQDNGERPMRKELHRRKQGRKGVVCERGKKL